MSKVRQSMFAPFANGRLSQKPGTDFDREARRLRCVYQRPSYADAARRLTYPQFAYYPNHLPHRDAGRDRSRNENDRPSSSVPSAAKMLWCGPR